MKSFFLVGWLGLALTIAIRAGTNPGALAFADVNIAAADMGGDVESLTDVFGPGLTGRRLIDGALTPTWQATVPVTYPHEATISFYERKSALVQALAIELPTNASLAPQDVEVWTSTDAAPQTFAKAAAQTLKAQGGVQVIAFPPVEARFIKLRILSGASPAGLEMAEVRVLEATRAGYTPLFTREPGAARWKGSPREAAQRGLEWLQQSAADWSKENDCYGCHVQTQVMMGQAIALRQGYRVSEPAMRMLSEFMRSHEGDPRSPAVILAAMGHAQVDAVDGTLKDPQLLAGLDSQLARQTADGAIELDYSEPPILQGDFMATANTLVALDWAIAHTADPKYSRAASRAATWIATHQPQTTQDRVFKILALTRRAATAEQRRIAWSVVEELLEQQQPDGGWKEVPELDGSNVFATGQVLFAFKQAGVSVSAAPFNRAVTYLLSRQITNSSPEGGSWRAEHTQSARPSNFAPTMWAVIGLAEAHGTAATGSLRVALRGHGGKTPARNVEFVLDVSGSMNASLGAATRWTTALDVLTQVVKALPDDLNVGLRVYGHRYPSKSAETCTDTELLVPLQKLDRTQLISAASRLKPRGDTPLVLSLLATADDLRPVHGGSVVLITDGEESCQGDLRAASAQLKASGLDLTLNIVGFTITGRAAQAELGSLAQSTGGRYFAAQDRAQLAKALSVAALQRLSYDVLDAAGKIVASGQTSELGRDLAPGSYRVRIDALGQVLMAPVTITADRMTTVVFATNGDRLVIRQD